MKILVTGGCGFVGTHLVNYLLKHTSHAVINLDVLTQASNPRWAKHRLHIPQYDFIQGDILDESLLQHIFFEHKPHAVIHLAAETDVDESIRKPRQFMRTNITGTEYMLTASLHYWQSLDGAGKLNFRYLQASTQEVYGDLTGIKDAARESDSYCPNSPYAASKAAADHLVRAWHQTYGLPTLITCSTHTFGPYQHSHKFIPHVLHQALEGKPLPIYGDGEQVRDWMHVDDHARGIYFALTLGKSGETYNLGSESPISNYQLVDQLCDILDIQAADIRQQLGIQRYRDLITFVDDRRGHDRRYCLNAEKAKSQLGWSAKIPFNLGLTETVHQYLNGDSEE